MGLFNDYPPDPWQDVNPGRRITDHERNKNKKTENPSKWALIAIYCGGAIISVSVFFLIYSAIVFFFIGE